VVSGTLTADGQATPVTGRLRGAELTLDIEGRQVRADVRGARLEGADLTGARARPEALDQPRLW
jgi:uncharacterized protein YjbI with pentapeptide repeats